MVGGTMLRFQIDAHQHYIYPKSDELARYNDAFMGLSYRFNTIWYSPASDVDYHRKRQCQIVWNSDATTWTSLINLHTEWIQGVEHTGLSEIHDLFCGQSIRHCHHHHQHDAVVHLVGMCLFYIIPLCCYKMPGTCSWQNMNQSHPTYQCVGKHRTSKSIVEC